jgi:ABC-type uncharacterized transport system ATPase subunit
MPEAGRAAALSVRQLSKTYADGFVAVDRLDVEIPVGAFFGLLGPNGAGWSGPSRHCSRLGQHASSPPDVSSRS